MKRRPTSKRRARTELNSELIEQLEALVRRGRPIGWACDAAGLSRQTLARWRSRGQADLVVGDDTIHAQLELRVAGALAQYLSGLLDELHETKHATRLRAVTWLLERRSPSEFCVASDPALDSWETYADERYL